MPVSRDRLHKLSRIGLISANVLVLLALVVTGVFIRLERGWAKPVFRDPEQAFRHGTIGTELMPLPVAYVLPDLFPEHFQPGGPQGGDWVEQFGFLRDSDPSANGGLPIGFVVSRYRPQSGAPSPVAFVGFSCALCHSTLIRAGGDQRGQILLWSRQQFLELVRVARCVSGGVACARAAAGGSKPRPRQAAALPADGQDDRRPLPCENRGEARSLRARDGRAVAPANSRPPRRRACEIRRTLRTRAVARSAIRADRPDENAAVPHADPHSPQSAGQRHAGVHQDCHGVLGRPAQALAVRRQHRQPLRSQLVGRPGSGGDGREHELAGDRRQYPQGQRLYRDAATAAVRRPVSATAASRCRPPGARPRGLPPILLRLSRRPRRLDRKLGKRPANRRGGPARADQDRSASA